MRAAIYIRVSTTWQADEGYSLSAQERSVHSYCLAKGYEIVDVYADRGISGKDIDHRPAMVQMLRDADNKRFDVIIVWALSRFTRSVVDLYQTCDRLQHNGIGLESCTEPFDTNSAMGRAMIGVMSVFAQMEREITGERVRAAMMERAQQGKRTCNEVLGYDKDGDSLKINEHEAEIVRYIFDRYLEYHNLSAVAELCRLKGYVGKRGREQSAYTVRVILTRPIYAGYNLFCGQLFKGHHPPIVSVHNYNKVQSMLLNSNVGRTCTRRKPIFIPTK